jgi:hypothetical protein
MAMQTDSELFTVRIWAEQANTTEPELRARVLHVDTGDVRHFHDWAALLAFLQEAIVQPGVAQPLSPLANDARVQMDVAQVAAPQPTPEPS